ncbi:glycosyltransferase family 9 protein, partial [Micromonospora sp. NPDC126480]|uniref:glycosyltransferase family 9 protein n=1 Tax=Micromonospora sp. NPDC126480 TaxID=3155312 RepID=UPI003324C397
INHLIDTPNLNPQPWTGPTPDIAVNLHGHGPQSHHLLTATHPHRLLAYTNPDANHHDGPPWRPDEHEVDRWCRLLAWYGIPADRTDLTLIRPPAGGVPAGVTIVHPGAKAPQRRWPVQRFAAVARQLTAEGHHVVVTGNHTERRRAEQVAQLAGLPDDAVLAGHTDLHHLAALVAHARLLISGDTGIAHLATAYHTPSVVLFGPVSPALWGPPPDRPRHEALWRGPYRGGRADDVPHPALAALDVPDVLAAVARVEAAARGGRREVLPAPVRPAAHLPVG